MSIIFEPSKDIISTCDLIDNGIAHFLRSMNNEHFGRYEYEVECLVNIIHSVRIFESIIELARKDLAYIQSALVLSRNIFETLIKVSWILHPPDIFECETRYVAQLNTECEFWRKWVKESKKLGADSDNYQDILEGISKFKDELSKILEDKGYSIPRLPNVHEALQSLNAETKYLNYIILSQYTHATHYAGKIYRRNLGTEKILSERVRLDDWKFVFAVCWPVFELATELYIYRTEGKEELYSIEFKEAVRNSFLGIA